MPVASAVEMPNMANTLNKEKFVNVVSNANTDKNTALTEEQKSKLQKWINDKNLTNNVLKLGSKGESVKKLQSWLKENQFYIGAIDGIYGNNTEAAVKIFQKEVGLREDGQAGDYTLLAMQQWDEIKASITGESTVNSDKVYSSVSTSSSYKNTIRYGKSYSRSSGWGYINGMDCWAMSDYIASKYNNQGYKTRILHAKTSYSNDHRWTEIYKGGRWVPAPDYGSLPKIYTPTYR